MEKIEENAPSKTFQCSENASKETVNATSEKFQFDCIGENSFSKSFQHKERVENAHNNTYQWDKVVENASSKSSHYEEIIQKLNLKLNNYSFSCFVSCYQVFH